MKRIHHFRLGGSIDMLTGPLLKKLLLFSLPLMASSVLQLLFNAADVVVVGRYASYASLAAVGSTTAIVNLVVNLLIGHGRGRECGCCPVHRRGGQEQGDLRGYPHGGGYGPGGRTDPGRRRLRHGRVDFAHDFDT